MISWPTAILFMCIGVMGGAFLAMWVVDLTERTRPTSNPVRESKQKFKNVVAFAAHDMVENPDDWEYKEVEEPYRRALLKHKSGRYVVHVKNSQHAKLIQPTGFEFYKGLDIAVHAWHLHNADRHFGKVPDAERDEARAEVDALTNKGYPLGVVIT